MTDAGTWGYVERWECEIPEGGVTYRVIDEEWDYKAEPMVRTIRQVEIVDEGVSHD